MIVLPATGVMAIMGKQRFFSSSAISSTGNAGKTLAFYPVITQATDLNDLIGRCAWYLLPLLDGIDHIRLTVVDSVSCEFRCPDYLDQEIESRIPKILDKVHIERVPNADNESLLDEASTNYDMLLAWMDLPDGEKSPKLLQTIQSFQKKGSYYSLDRNRTRMEGSYYLWMGVNNFNAGASVIPDCIGKMEAFGKKHTEKDKCYVFGTGPSLAAARDYDFSDGVCIVSNSMIKNKELMRQLSPAALIAGDPQFHAGCSKYAGEFRRTLVEAMEEFDFYLFIPLRDYHIYLNYLPEKFHGRIIGVPFDAKKPYNINLTKDFYVSPKANILTLLGLPIGGTFYKEVVVVGCDGRPLEDDGYFWSHDKSSQFNENMENIKEVHPGFFKINYNEYYTEHCEIVLLAVNAMEREGTKVSSLTPSYIPALRDRYKDPLADTGKLEEVIVIDPDALDNFGHYLSYDDNLKRACDDAGLAFSVFGNVGCENRVVDERPFFERVFTVHSWRIGYQPKGLDMEPIKKFAAELYRGLELRRERGLRRKAVCYMYCGSLQVAEVVYGVLKDFPEIHATINLFWLSFIDYRNWAYILEWRPLMTAMIHHGRIRIEVPTKALAESIDATFGITLPVPSHPSTTFHDQQAEELFRGASTNQNKKKRPHVLFPGGLREEKGISLTQELAPRLAKNHSDRLDVTVRAFAQKKQIEAFQELDSLNYNIEGTTCVVNSENMDDQAYADFLSGADIIILPYRTPDFLERTSGLLIDAIFLGIPVVVCQKTWLSDVVSEFGNGLSVPQDDVDAFEAAIIQISDNYKVFSTAAEAARVAYLRENSWRELINTILSVDSAHKLLFGHSRVLKLLSGPLRSIYMLRFRISRITLQFLRYLKGLVVGILT